MKNLISNLVCLCVVAVFGLTSCMTIFKGTKTKVKVDAPGVETPVTLMWDSKVVRDVYLPYSIKVKRNYKPTTLTAKAEGYSDAKVVIDKKFDTGYLWNLLMWPGLLVDAASGSMMKPESKDYTIYFRSQEKKEVKKEKPVQTQVERVVKENPGNTSMEKTIIRWYFDSEPQGARLFWRVVSSVPDEVKNTNELWLGNTPFEETRSFNIMGLTKENAHNVQIEIKVKRNGYMDQTKRFNVGQALDQQEISSFFEMIKK